MIVSASRRTDLAACYPEWLCRRLREGYALVPHPRDSRRLSRVSLSPEAVDCLVLWTKNPEPFLPYLDEVEQRYPFYFQFTLTPYGRDMEPGLPSKERLAELFCALSRRLGPDRVDWRYDPILLDARHTTAYHLDRFEALCRHLHEYTGRCILSFADPYRHLGDRVRPVEEADQRALACGFSRIAARYRLPLFTCAEHIDLSEYGIFHASCIDPAKIGRLLGCRIQAKPDRGQRPDCGCVESVDIGAYDTCPNGCIYCYAAVSRARTARNLARHDPLSPMLVGRPTGEELITERKMRSVRTEQTSLF